MLIINTPYIKHSSVTFFNIKSNHKLPPANWLSMSCSVLVAVYQPAMLPAFGHCVTLLLALAQHEGLRKLAIKAMTCLTTVGQIDRHGE